MNLTKTTFIVDSNGIATILNWRKHPEEQNNVDRAELTVLSNRCDLIWGYYSKEIFRNSCIIRCQPWIRKNQIQAEISNECSSTVHLNLKELHIAWHLRCWIWFPTKSRAVISIYFTSKKHFYRHKLQHYFDLPWLIPSSLSNFD